MNRLLICLVLVACHFSSIVVGDPTSMNWNTFLRSDGHFPAEHESSETLIQLSGSNKKDLSLHQNVLAELQAVLNRPEVLHKFYTNYLNSVQQSGIEVSEYRTLDREQIFKEALMGIAKQNLEYESGRSGWFAGATPLIHFTKEEFQQKYNSAPDAELDDALPTFNEHDKIHGRYPKTLNWKDKGVVTDVKNQDGCGCCYAFQTAAVMEGAYARQFGSLMSLSPEDIRDCMEHHGGPPNCHGSNFMYAIEYVQQQGGLPSNDDYPYNLDSDIHPCSSDGLPRYHNVASANGVKTHGDERKLIEHVNKYGPVGVSVDSHETWHTYKGGILDAPCIKTGHAVTLIGYNEEAYIIKNSWGTDWGEKGYIRLTRGTNSSCVAKNVFYVEEMIQDD